MNAPDRILIVDDQEPNVRLLETILNRSGYSVRGVMDSRQVARVIEDFDPDLVLLDLHMPHLDGFSVLQQTKNERAVTDFLPVVMLTADSDQRTRHKALQLGASDFLTKPLDAHEVLLRCRNLLATRRLYKALHETNEEQANAIVALATDIDASRRIQRGIVKRIEKLSPEATIEERAKAFVDQVCEETGIAAAALVLFDKSATGETAAGTLLAVHGVAAGADAPDAVIAQLNATYPGHVWEVRFGDPASYECILAVATGPSHEHHEDETVDTMTAELASTAAMTLGPALRQRAEWLRGRSEVAEVISAGAFWPVFQPLVDMKSGGVFGYEALTRFADGTRPDLKFAVAVDLDMGVELEVATLKAVLSAARALPPACALSINASPDFIRDPRLAALLAEAKRSVIVEVTEHVEIADYGALRKSISTLKPRVQIAIDDAGAGYASFSHVLELRPDYVKLDASLVRSIDGDASRQALVVGMCHFAEQTGTQLLAEGVETEAERAMLEHLGVPLAQGFLFGRPERALALAS